MAALRPTAVILLLLGVLVGAVTQIPGLAWESGRHEEARAAPPGTNTTLRYEGAWSMFDDQRVADAGGNLTARTTNATAYYDARLDLLPNGEASPGIVMVRLGSPVMSAGLLLALVGLFFLLARKALAGAILAAFGAVGVVAGLLMLVLGLAAFNQDTGDGVRFPLGLDVGFWLACAAALLALAAALLAFADPAARKGKADTPLFTKPILSVDNPRAFDPLRSRDPRPFKADAPTEYREFQVMGPKTFRASGPPSPGDPSSPPAEGKPDAKSAGKAPAAATTGSAAATPAKASGAAGAKPPGKPAGQPSPPPVAAPPSKTPAASRPGTAPRAPSKESAATSGKSP